MARMSISLPDELKEQMDAIKGENWSAVATEAFRVKLIERANWRFPMKKEEIVARMKAAQEKDGLEELNDGKLAGKRWAAQKATPRQLDRLESYTLQCERDRTVCWDTENTMWMAPYGAPEYLYFAINPRDNDDGDAAARFWEGVLDNEDDKNNSDFLRGFVEGALELWKEVRNDL